MRRVLIGVDDATGTLGFRVDGGALLELGPFEDSVHAVLRLANTCALSKRKLRKGMVWDIGPRPRRGVVIKPTEWHDLAQGDVSSTGEAIELLSRAHVTAASLGLQQG